MFSIKRAERPIFSRPRNPWYLTVLLIVLSFIFMKITQSLIGAMTPPLGMINDRLQNWTFPINQYFQIHKEGARALLITTSFWIDLCALFLCLRAIFGPTIRPFLELFLFGLYRQALQFLVSLPLPEGIIWTYPGFPSLVVDYVVQNDFYFSAHTGIALLCALEFVRTRKKWLDCIGFFLFGYVVITLISFRIHYTMDIFTAIFVVLYLIYTSERLSQPIDRYLQSLGKRIGKIFS